jgi:RNA polymerase sigma factor (sigma-70 family)
MDKTIADNLLTFSEDDGLIIRLLSGDDHAFSTLYEKYVNELFAYGSAWQLREEILEDAIHDIFCKLYFNRKLFRNIGNIKLYLFKMLKNKIIDIFKTSKEIYSISESEMEFAVKSTVVDEMIMEEDKIEIQQKVDSLLSRLTEHQREVVYLRFILEMEYEEIGLLLNITPQTARNIVFRAMESMREVDFMLFLLFLSGCLLR